MSLVRSIFVSSESTRDAARYACIFVGTDALLSLCTNLLLPGTSLNSTWTDSRIFISGLRLQSMNRSAKIKIIWFNKYVAQRLEQSQNLFPEYPKADTCERLLVHIFSDDSDINRSTRWIQTIDRKWESKCMHGCLLRGGGHPNAWTLKSTFEVNCQGASRYHQLLPGRPLAINWQANTELILAPQNSVSAVSRHPHLTVWRLVSARGKGSKARRNKSM